jgi:hypothetical protein
MTRAPGPATTACLVISSIIFSVFLLASDLQGKPAQLSERELREAMREGLELVKAQTVAKDFVIVKSTPTYEESRRTAVQAAQRLNVPLNLRGLSPHSGGLTFSTKDCAENAFDYPCYVARGRGDDGFYVSIEHSTAYENFRPGLYIVIVASDSKGGSVAKQAAKAARKFFSDAYIRSTGVYMGCMH